MLQIEPQQRISIPNILKHDWLKSEDEFVEDEDDEHDFEMGISFRRQECNFNPLSMIGMSELNNPVTSNNRAHHAATRHQMNPELAEELG